MSNVHVPKRSSTGLVIPAGHPAYAGDAVEKIAAASANVKVICFVCIFSPYKKVEGDHNICVANASARAKMLHENLYVSR
jgi:hypothetical protein